MNVSRNAYFTLEYLQERQRTRPRTPLHRHSPDNAERTPRTLAESARVDAPDEIDNPDELTMELTPAQLTHLSRQQRPRRARALVDYYDYYDYKPRRRRDAESVEYEPSTYTEEESVAAPGDFSGYYIEQKKRFDEAADVKPTLYTHKTFQDVFEKDVEERLNPIDVVFEDTERARELEQKPTLGGALRRVQKQLGKDDYASYDYYVQKKMAEAARAQEEAAAARRAEKERAKRAKAERKLRKKKKPTVEEVFVENPLDLDGGEWQDGAAEARPVKKQLRLKWKNAKRLLGTNYFDNYKREVLEREQIRRAKNGEPLLVSDSAVAQDPYTGVGTATPVTEQSVDPVSGAVGPQDRFHPIWNYMLSWLVPQPSAAVASRELVPASNAVVENVPESVLLEPVVGVAAPPVRRAKRGKSRFSMGRTKNMLQNWNQPALAFFAGQRVEEPRQVQFADDAYADSMLQPLLDYPEEYEVGIGEDEEFEDELVYNPDTKQLEPVVRNAPTSALAMMVPPGRFAQLLHLHSGTPLTIVLNLNRMIKSIRIMKILFAPIDVVAEAFPNMQTVVILVELVIFMWILYELSLLIDALCMAVKAVCAPMIAIGKFMNRIV